MIEHKKNTAYYLSFPAIDATAPDKYKTGITPVASAVYKDGSGAWTTLVLSGVVTEIGTLGIYEITFTAAELNHDKVTVKLSVSGMADDAFQFDLATKVVTDLNDIPATDIVSAGAITTLSGSVVNVDSTDTVTDGAKSSTALDKTVWTDAKAAFIDAAITTRNSVAPDNAGIVGIQSDLSNATDGLGALKADISLRMLETSINTTGGAVDSVSSVVDGAKAVVATEARLSELDSLVAGKMANQVDVIQIDTSTDLVAQIAALENISQAQVLTQVNGALDTAISELGVGIPSATPSIRDALMLLYMATRNLSITDTTLGSVALKIHNDLGTEITSKALSDDGTIYTESKMA